jgi:ribosomal protein L21E
VGIAEESSSAPFFKIMRKTITVKYNQGDLVTLKSEPDVIRTISGYLIKGRNITYGLAKGAEEESWHVEDEISPVKKNVIVKGFKG